MSGHALLSPSGASRWLACTPSARLESNFEDNTSAAAEEGTLAHALSELYLRNNLKLINTINFNKELKKIKNNPLYNSDLNAHCLDYVSFVLDKIGEYKEPTIKIEEKISLEDYVPEGFGTVDFVLISDYMLEIVDLKYGKGVLVEAHENKQMMLYALGALQKFSLLYHIDEVRMTIYQPRLDNYSSYGVDAKWLMQWGEEFVKPRANKAFQGDGNYEPGSHCRFCKARNQCKALAEHNMTLAKYSFEDPNKLSDEAIAEILEKAPDFKVWLTNITAYALEQAVKNEKKWPGFKLVAGRSSRKIVDEAAVVDTLLKQNYGQDLFLTAPKLLSITALEKNFGKSEVSKLLGNFITKPAGAATLVPVWDKRAELSSTEAAVAAFEDVENLQND
jgi:hypothetical protein